MNRVRAQRKCSSVNDIQMRLERFFFFIHCNYIFVNDLCQQTSCRIVKLNINKTEIYTTAMCGNSTRYLIKKWVKKKIKPTLNARHSRTHHRNAYRLHSSFSKQLRVIHHSITGLWYLNSDIYDNVVSHHNMRAILMQHLFFSLFLSLFLSFSFSDSRTVALCVSWSQCCHRSSQLSWDTHLPQLHISPLHFYIFRGFYASVLFSQHFLKINFSRREKKRSEREIFLFIAIFSLHF